MGAEEEKGERSKNTELKPGGERAGGEREKE